MDWFSFRISSVRSTVPLRTVRSWLTEETKSWWLLLHRRSISDSRSSEKRPSSNRSWSSRPSAQASLMVVISWSRWSVSEGAWRSCSAVSRGGSCGGGGWLWREKLWGWELWEGGSCGGGREGAMGEGEDLLVEH